MLRLIPRFSLPRAVRLALPLLIATSPCFAQVQRPTPDALVDQAWTLLPLYDGEHRPFLSSAVRAQTLAANHLLEAALQLEPEHVRGLWSLGHAHVLLAEDRRNRGLREEAHEHEQRVESALGRAIVLQDDDPWAFYARGTARTAAGRHREALSDLERAVALVEERIEGGEGQLEWLRFKILGWRAEVQMRTGDHVGARERLRAYHAEFSTNSWPLLIALAESHLRARDFAGAAERYLEILEAFRSDHQAYALLGYLEGLRGNLAAATERLEQALERELEPGIYTRIWLMILSTDEVHEAAIADLAALIANPPPGPTEWDLALGSFLLGGESPEEFEARMWSERARRIEAGLALDDLECEAWFYMGLRYELDAAAVQGEDRRALIANAVGAHRRSLSFSPLNWKWEWAFARLHFADLAQELGIAPAGRWVGSGGTLPIASIQASLIAPRWHAPRAASAAEDLGREPRPGDLVIGIPVLAGANGEWGSFLLDASLEDTREVAVDH